MFRRGADVSSIMIVTIGTTVFPFLVTLSIQALLNHMAFLQLKRYSKHGHKGKIHS